MISCPPLPRLFAAAAMIASLALSGGAFAQPTTTQPAGDQHAATSPDPSAKEVTVLQERPDRIIATLPNRMIVIAQELPTAPVVSAQIWVKTGSIYEQEHVGAGLSHFLEHLVSAGSTDTRTEAESNRLLGAIGGQTNAATGLDNVHYYINTTSDHTAAAVDLLSDWLRYSKITNAEYQREQEVILREFEHGLGSPGRVFWKLTQQARFRAHPARHPTIGYIDEFTAVSRDEIFDFYKRMYVPNNMVFVVVGDIDKQKVVDQIASLWADAPMGELPQVALPVEADIEQPRELSGEAAIRSPRLRIAWPGTRLGGEHDYALDLLGAALGQGELSRLVRTVRDEQRLVNTVDAFNLSFSWGEGFFGVDAEVAVPPGATDVEAMQGAVAEAIDQTKAAIMTQVRKIKDEGVTEAELARARRQALAYTIYSSQSAQAIASRMARDLIGMGDPDYMVGYVEALEAITAADVQDAANEILDDQRMIVVTLLPRASDEQPEALKRPDDAGAGEAVVDEVAVTLDNRRLIDEIKQLDQVTGDDKPALEIEPVHEFTLSNGLRLLVQRNTLVPAVSIQYYSLGGGLLSEEPGQEGVANAAAMMLTRGTRTRSAREIEQAIESLGASLGASSGNNTFYVQARSLSEDWPTVLDLFADVLLNPTFPQDEWENVQRRLLAAIDRQRDSWSSELSLAFRESYYGDAHPWASTPLGRREVIASLTPEKMAAFHKSRLNANNTVMAVFGDVEPERVRAAVEEKLAALPKQAAAPFDPPQPADPDEGLYPADTKQAMSAIQVGFGPGVARDHADFPALQVLANVLSDFPSGWLEQQLRGAQGDGLAYAVWGYNVSGVVPGYLAVGFNTSPDLVPEALRRTMSVIRRARTERVDDDSLARAKAAVLSREYLGKQSNSDRAADAALRELYGMGDEDEGEFLRKVNAVTPEMLQVVARTYLINPVAVILHHQPLDEDALKTQLDLELKDEVQVP